MIKGQVNCSCGQEFWFETILEVVVCPKCHKSYESLKYGIDEQTEEIIESPKEEDMVAGVYKQAVEEGEQLSFSLDELEVND